jgi:tetraacyldisaccharide-1-P 4'-kinase
VFVQKFRSTDPLEVDFAPRNAHVYAGIGYGNDFDLTVAPANVRMVRRNTLRGHEHFTGRRRPNTANVAYQADGNGSLGRR